MRKNMILLIGGLLVLAGCATSTDLNRLERRVASLESENRTLNLEVQMVSDKVTKQKESEDSFRQLYAGQDADFYRLKEDVRKLNGRLDETDHRVNQEFQSLKDSMQNLHDAMGHVSAAAATNGTRLKRVEDYMGFEPGKKPAVSRTPGEALPDKFTEKGMYLAAKQGFDKGDFEAAQEGFEGFLKKYPKSDMADNARFWIGEIYFQEGWYRKAILEYQRVIEGYPHGNKAPAAYLKQGIAFHKLGENANAKLILKELIEKFPSSNEAALAKKEISSVK